MKQEFKLQLKLSKTFLIFESSSAKWDKHFSRFQVFSVILMMFNLTTFFPRFDLELSEITEDLSRFVTTTMGVTKFIFFLIYTKEIFGIIGELKELNSKCE